MVQHEKYLRGLGGEWELRAHSPGPPDVTLYARAGADREALRRALAAMYAAAGKSVSVILPEPATTDEPATTGPATTDESATSGGDKREGGA